LDTWLDNSYNALMNDLDWFINLRW